MRELIEAYDEYIKTLESQNGSILGLAYAHGWCCPPERIKRGKELRAKIAELKLSVLNE